MPYSNMRELINKLNDATKAYDEGCPYMSDHEWDKLYFDLECAEEYHGFAYPDSPTQKINYQVVSSLEKVTHNHPMLSLEKTKSIKDVENFYNKQKTPALVMLKLDGLTCSIEYRNGVLFKAETRGDGNIGEDITHNAWVIDSIPKDIPYMEPLIVDGEIICTYQNFKEFEEQYKNPRNFASGSIRLLDPAECKKRKLTFVAWEVIGFPNLHHLSTKLDVLSTFNFCTVPFYDYELDNFSEPLIEYMKNEAKEFGYPIDGIVVKYDDVSLKEKLGSTAHHFNNAIAYKFYDETYTTSLKDIEWTMGRTGVLTPVAVFEPIDIDGSIVERASLHNVSIMIETLHGHGWKGQKVEVFKANMIIPQIASAELDDDRCKYYFERVIECPVCGGSTSIVTSDSGVKTLICANPQCEGKLINQLDHYCSKKGLDIKGLSKTTLEKLVNWGWITNIAELYDLHNMRSEWIRQTGFGEKSVDKILTAIEESKKCNLIDFIAALGIPLIGKTVAKELVKYINDYDDFRNKIKNNFDFSTIEGFGPMMNDAIHKFNYDQADYIFTNCLINVAKNQQETKVTLNNLKFCITGKLKLFKNRDELKSFIEQNGGKVVSSISTSTNYLINNDIASTSAKNKSAQALNIPIISEEDFKKLFDL